MKQYRLIYILMFLSLLPLFIGATAENRSAEDTVMAAPLGGIGQELCNRIYLPIIIGQSGAGSTAVVADNGIITPPGATNKNPECAGFPDFNGDGYADLAIGAPHKGNFDTGIVQVVYGTGAGLNAGSDAVINDQVWSREAGSVAPEQNDFYGSAIALGDFNNDGYDDLAVGIPGAQINGLAGAGAVQVIYGSNAGLTNNDIEEWSRATLGINGDAELNANFGASLAAGDFDGDGYDDLAVGVPQANVNGDTYAGAVNILYGLNLGLGITKNELITQDTSGFIATSTEPFDYFGWALAAGDFNNDGIDDLAVGTPFEDNGVGFADAGSVQVFFGTSGSTANESGLIVNGSVPNPQHWNADSPNVEGVMEENDRFGYALTVADFNGDSYDDLAIGSPFETHGSGAGALANGGAVNVIMGSANGPAATASQLGLIWHQDLTGMNGVVDTSDRFGYTLTAGDFDNDGYADLVVGVPGDDYVLGMAETGSAQLIYGSANGLTTAGNSLYYHPNLATGDFFGATVFAADFNGDGAADLAAGAPLAEPVMANSGAVITFYSNTTQGLLQSENQTWYPGGNGLTGTAVADDQFGNSLPGNPRR